MNQQDVWDYTYDGTTSIMTDINETPYGGGTSHHDIDHDGAGNLTLDELSTYAYDPRNTLDSQQSGGSDRFRWTFNSAGLRVGTEGPLPGTATATHHLLLDGMLGHEVYAEGGVPTEEWSYVYLEGRLFARLAPEGSAEHIISDHIAFPLAVTDDDGEILWEAGNRPFGEIEAVLAGTASHDPRLRYPGQWVVEGVPADTTELFANGYRWYRGRWGRYSQSDPVGLWGGMNLFSYSGTNPLRFIDPLGLFDIDVSCDNCDWGGNERIEEAVELAKKMAPCVFRQDIRNWFQANPDGDGITIFCDDAYSGCLDGVGEGGSPSAGGGDRFWLCTERLLRNGSLQQIANTILHEWMHKIPWGSDGVTDHNHEAGGIADQAERWYMRGLCEDGF